MKYLLLISVLFIAGQASAQQPKAKASESERLSNAIERHFRTGNNDSIMMQMPVFIKTLEQYLDDHTDAPLLFDSDTFYLSAAEKKDIRDIIMEARNASENILKSFHLIEQSFNNESERLDSINNILLRQLGSSDSAYTNMADRIRIQSSSLIAYIDSVEHAMVSDSNNARIRGANLASRIDSARQAMLTIIDDSSLKVHAISADFTDYISHIQSYIESEHPAQLSQLKAKELQEKINNTRYQMLSYIKDSKVRIQMDKNTMLRADDPEDSEGSWASMYIEHSPMAGIFALLTKLKDDCKTLEVEVLAYLAKD